MNTFVIALDRNYNDFSPNLNFLYNISDVDGHQLVIHNDPNVSLTPLYEDSTSTIVHNFHHLLTGSIIDTDYLTTKKQHTSLFRENKLTQQGKLINAFNRHVTKELGTHISFPNPIFNSTNVLNLSFSSTIKLIVSKPLMGARGLSMFLLDSSKGDIGSEHSLIIDYIKKEMYQDGKKITDIIDAAKEKYPTLVEYSLGNERSENESLKHLNVGHRILTPFIDNIKAEYRLLTIGGRAVYIQHRDRMGAGLMKFASGSGHGKINTTSLNIHEVFKNHIHNSDSELHVNFINSVIRDVLPDIGSVDLYFTEDQKYGIFEYSTEFGTAGLTSDLQLKFWEKFVSYLIKKTEGLIDEDA